MEKKDKNAKMNISIIVAMDKNQGIGKDNKIPWYISDDLKRFKKITTNNVVIMGRKTWFSLPYRPLKNRKNIVLTSSKKTEQFEGSLIVRNLDEIFQAMEKDKENFIIGGYRLYKAFLTYTNKLYLTIVHEEFEVDTYFPDLELDKWTQISKEDFFDAPIPYSNLVFEKNEKKIII